MIVRILCVFLLACASALAQGASVPQFHQNLGVDLPLHTVFLDSHGLAKELGEYFGSTPVVVVFGYYHCPRLCDTIMDGVLQAVQDAGLPHTIVGIGVDPRETPADAARKLAAHQDVSDSPGTLHLLTGGQDQISRLADAAGFEYKYDKEHDQYSHPAGFLVATPDGKTSRYFSGLRFDRRDVRLALIEASNERVGTLSEQVLLRCSHYDPVAGRYSVTVMAVVRTIGALTVVLLVGGILLARRRS